MTYKIPDPPSPQAKLPELADFIEFECLKSSARSISLERVYQILRYGEDDLLIDGIDSEEDSLKVHIQEAFGEIHRRVLISGERYPFSFNDDIPTVVVFQSEPTPISVIYRFLLLATSVLAN